MAVRKGKMTELIDVVRAAENAAAKHGWSPQMQEATRKMNDAVATATDEEIALANRILG